MISHFINQTVLNEWLHCFCGLLKHFPESSIYDVIPNITTILTELHKRQNEISTTILFVKLEKGLNSVSCAFNPHIFSCVCQNYLLHVIHLIPIYNVFSIKKMYFQVCHIALLLRALPQQWKHAGVAVRQSNSLGPGGVAGIHSLLPVLCDGQEGPTCGGYDSGRAWLHLLHSNSLLE